MNHFLISWDIQVGGRFDFGGSLWEKKHKSLKSKEIPWKIATASYCFTLVRLVHIFLKNLFSEPGFHIGLNMGGVVRNLWEFSSIVPYCLGGGGFKSF